VTPFRKAASFVASFGHAWNGLVNTLVHQRNMRVHAVAALLVCLVGSGVPLGVAEETILIFCILLVFFAEILNSALEALVDLATEKLHEKARITKDAAAGGVLVLALGVVVVFAAILLHNWSLVMGNVPLVLRHVKYGVPLALLQTLLVLPGRRPPVLDLLALLAGGALLATLARATTSAVFTALAGMLMLLAYAAALRHRPWRG
jgi:diacylglycerol kinase (ATP)